MNKIILALFFSTVLIVGSLYAQHSKEVLLKFSKQENQMRIVFESEVQLINKSKITTSTNQIKIEFPELFKLTAQKSLPFEVVITGKTLVVNLREKNEIKFFKLSSPARLVFDVLKKEIQSEKQPEPILSKVFVLDAGHGGYDSGIIAGDVREKEIAINIVKDLNTFLSKKGKKVFLTRRVDQYMSLVDRIKVVNQKSPDVFISFHFSMSENFVLYVPVVEEKGPDEIADLYSLSSRQKKYIRKSRALSDNIGKAIKDEFKVSVIYREMPLPILNSADAPAVLIEFPSPHFMIYDQQTRERLVYSIINGIAAYGQQI